MTKTARPDALGAFLVGIVAAASASAEPADRPMIKFHRFDEDWRPLCNPGQRSEALDLFKCIPLNPTRDSTLTVGGEVRERFEIVRNPGFGIDQSSDHVFLHRMLLHGDLRIGPALRFFAQLGAFEQNGREQARSATDVDRLDVTQAFVDVSLETAGEGRLTFRGGRQEMSFGSSRLVSVREGPNVRRSFDAARAFWLGSGYRADAFYARPITVTASSFDDRANRREALWGIYGTGPVPSAPELNADAYYLGFDRDRARFATGTADERRRTLGARLFGDHGGLDWDIEAAYQFGDFGNMKIRAWTVASDVGFTLTDFAFEPRIGLKADLASGDRAAGDSRLGTFNALYPKFPYFSEAAVIAPANVMDLHPSGQLHLGRSFTVEIGWDFLWRHTKQDAIYHPPLNPVGGTAGRRGRFIGHQAIAGLQWEATPHVTIAAQYVHFTPGETLKLAGGRVVDFLLASAAYKF